MKGRISENLEKILRDSEGRKQLRQSLVSGRDGTVRTDSATYRVSSKGEFASSKDSGTSPQKGK